MNNLNTTVTSAFLSGLEKQKEVIKEVNPLLIFRRVLGVSEAPTARDIVAALQNASSRVGKLQEMQKNFSSPSRIGEIITFDIGPANVPSWFKFTVIREPLDADNGQTAINFAVIVTDKKAGKRWNRIIGAMQRETNKNGEKQTVFRLIKDICNEEDIEKESEVEQDGIVITAGTQVTFRKRRGHDDEIIVDSAENESELFRFSDPDTRNIDTSIKYTAKNDIMRSAFKGSVSEIMKNFDAIKTKTPEAAPPPPEPPKEEKKDEPAPEPVVIHEGELVKFEETSDKVYKAKQDLTQTQVNDIVESNKISEFFDEQLPEPPPEIPTPAKEKEAPDLPAVNASAPVGDAPIEVPGESQEAEEPVAPASQEMVGYEAPAEEAPTEEQTQESEAPADDQPEPSVAVDTSAPADADPVDEPKSETTQEQPKETEQPMSDEIVYRAGDITTFFGDARTWRITQDVTKSMLQAAKGDMSAYAVVVEEPNQPEAPAAEPAEEQPHADEQQPAEESAPVGDIPEPRKKCGEEHSRGEFLRMLFGTANPNIMHLFSVLKAEAGNATFQATGTWPIEQMIAYPTYSFSIIKMKNGRFYRVFVAHTDKENLNNSTWLETKDVKDRWFELCDIQDREVGRILDMRERR